MTLPLDFHTGLDDCPTLVQMLAQRAELQPNDCAYKFLREDEDAQTIDYQELDRQARAIAVWLAQRGLSGQPVILAYPAGIEFVAAFFGCIYSGAIAVPINPPRRNAKLSRTQIVADASGATVALTTSSVTELLESWHKNGADLQQLEWQATDHLVESIAAEDWTPPEVTISSLAALQFTSGSTGAPRGVMLTHSNLMHNSDLIRSAFAHDENAIGLTWLPNYHDMGLIGTILQPMHIGRPSILMSPASFLQKPILWLKAISEHRATTSGGPNSAYDLCVDSVSDEQMRGLDLSSWQVAYNGAEPVRARTIDRFCERFAAVGFRREAFYPCYGLAEATLIVAGGLADRAPQIRPFDEARLGSKKAMDPQPDQPSVRLVSSGQTLSDQSIRIVEPNERVECGDGEIGEIWVAGPSVAQGYWQQPDETRRVFEASLANDDSGSFLRTGDLGFVFDEELFVTGRLKDLIIVNGINHYPQDIEQSVAQCHPALRNGGGAVFSSNGTDGERLVVVHEIERSSLKSDPDEMLAAIGSAVLENHGLNVHAITLIRPFSLPKTTSGKVARHVCREQFEAGELKVVSEWARPEGGREYVAPRNPVEGFLVDIWQQVLGLDRVGVHDSFFDLGGASSQSVEIASLAADQGLNFEPGQLFRYATIAELASTFSTAETQSFLQQRDVEQHQPADTQPSNGHVAAKPLPKSQSQPAASKKNLLIESLGVYLPEKVVSTTEIIRGCTKDIWFPLQSMTGIENRRIASQDELSIGMAIKAVDECLKHSKYRQEHIDLVVCANISRCDKPGQYSCEPSSSMKLKNHFGFDNALIFDLSNACAGMFTGIKLVESFLASGAIRCGMVVSGEYISGLIDTAQKEIKNFLDPRLACLTVGDAGAAVILESSANKEVGFHALDLYTVSEHAELCIGGFTEEPHGGAIMHTDPIKHTAVAIKHAVRHAVHTFEVNKWPTEEMNHVLMHQTSDRSLRNGAKALNKALKKKVCNKHNTVNNLPQRANTATTTHFVALWDKIADGSLHDGDKIAFAISGSGHSVGTGLYTFDGLPDRIAQERNSGSVAAKLPVRLPDRPRRTDLPRVRIESVGTLPVGDNSEATTWEMCKTAGEACFEASQYQREDIEILSFAGLYRTKAVQEPAIAALVGNELDVNSSVESEESKKTFCFDILNGGIGLLNACQVANCLIQSGTNKNMMIIASEVAFPQPESPHNPIPIQPTASAIILDRSPDGTSGFGEIKFRYFPEFFDCYEAYGVQRDGAKHFVAEQRDPALNELIIKCVTETVAEYLDEMGLDLAQVRAVMPPQISSEFVSQLGEALDVPAERMIDVVGPHGDVDLYTSSLPYAYQSQAGSLQPGDIALVIAVGAGLQVGVTTYHF